MSRCDPKSSLGRFVLPLAAMVLSSLPAAPARAGDTDAAVFQTKMGALYRGLLDIIVNTTSQERFDAPANRAKLDGVVKRLSETTHDLSAQAGGGKVQVDPSLVAVAASFREEAERARAALQAGNRPYARQILGGMSSFCISCHTRNASGPDFSKLDLPLSLSDLPEFERARVLAATRRFTSAIDLFEKIVTDPKVLRERPLEAGQAARLGLAIAVRVNKDPDRALALVEHVIRTPGIPFELKYHASRWRDSLGAWKAEPRKELATSEALYAEAMRLTAQAKEMQRFPADPSADVLFLRASAVLHDLIDRIESEPGNSRAADAYLMAGMSYEQLRDLSPGALHEVYFATCIRKAPGTPVAGLCYQRYEQSVKSGYTGTGTGTGSGSWAIPEAEKRNLLRYERLARPNPGPAKN